MYRDAVRRGGFAVVTGAASGVGRVAAQRFAEAGLGVVLADLGGEALERAAAAIGAIGPAHPVPTDVSDAASVAALADAAFGLGEVAVLMNNAGIALPSKSWEHPENWRRMIEVNLFGVLNGVQAFLPRMIAADRPAVVVNTGSKQGITSPPGNPGYNVSKAGVKMLTEMLAHDLRTEGAPVTAHLFVPGFTWTGMIARFMPERPAAAWTGEETVDHLLARMAEGDFYILCPDNDVTPDLDRRRVAWAAGDIVENRPALSRWHPDFAEAYTAFEKG